LRNDPWQWFVGHCWDGREGGFQDGGLILRSLKREKSIDYKRTAWALQEKFRQTKGTN
jgi:hypothetical protein